MDKSSESRSGWITVPPPRGFWTFLIRIGTLRRMTCREKVQLFVGRRGGSKKQNLYLLHCERVYDLTTIIGQFGRFIRGDD